MIQESLLKTNFLGRDGFRWWIGQIPQESAHGGQINGAGWGNRYKVRIMGYHPYDITELPDEDLPWAQCLLPTTAGTGAGNNSTSVVISPGDVVFGFFLDTDNAQTPVIMGCFGRTSQVLTSKSAGPFQPFTGYTDKIKKPNGTLKPEQSNEQNLESQKSPRHVSPEQAEKIGEDEIAYFSGTGDKVQLANTVNNTTINKISTEVNNLLNKVKAPSIFTDIRNEINRVTDKIQAISNGLVGNMMNKLYKYLAPVLNQGLKLLYQQVYNLVFAATQNPVIAHAAGVAAQTAMVVPVKALQEAIPCVSAAIIDGLGSVINEILNSVVDNVQNFVSCAADQFAASLVNDIISKISSGLSFAIDGVQKILQFFPSFSVDNFFRTTSDAIKGLVGLFDCNQSKGKVNGIVDQWIIGYGPSNIGESNFAKILENANISSSSQLLSFDDCYVGVPKSCNPPTINIFGGNGIGAYAIPLLGAISNGTASIIGAKLINRGSGYRFPPFVEIVDNCNQGYGAIARATINDNGEIDSIYMVSQGENYPIDTIQNYIVTDVLIQNPGTNYSPNDTVTDNFGNDYEIEISDGSIVKAKPKLNTDGQNNEVIFGNTANQINTFIVNDLPLLTVNSETGSGAILRPILDINNITADEFQGNVKQSIDCVK